MKTVFVLYKSAYESQCATDTEVEIHQTLDSAKAALRKEYDEHLEMPDSEFYTKSISDDGMTADCRSGDWFYSYWIKEREVRQAEGEEQAGDVAAMRKTLEQVANMPQCDDCIGKNKPNCDSCCKEAIFSPYVQAARAALSAKPRNCDVGTLTEQQQRFHDYCERMQHTDKACCGGCPIVHLRMQGVIGNSCELAWAQMPYRKEGAK